MSENNFDLETYDLELKPGERKDIIMLLRNKGNYENYSWSINHTVSAISGEVECNNISFDYKSDMHILSGQDSTPPIILKVPDDIQKGTCFFELTAKDSMGYVKTLSLTVNII